MLIVISIENRVNEFKLAVNRGKNIPYFVSEFLNKEKNKIQNGIETDFDEWEKQVCNHPEIRFYVRNPNKRTFNYYRNLWYKVNFKTTFQEYHHKEKFNGKRPYLLIDCKRGCISRFPQVSRILISSFIYKKLEKGLTDYNRLIKCIKSFIIQDKYKKSEDFIDFFKYYSPRKSRERNIINDKELIMLKLYLISPDYESAFHSYFRNLIKLIILIRSKRTCVNDESQGMNVGEIISKFNLNFSKNELFDIVKFLTRRYDLTFFFSQTEIEWLNEYGIDTNKIRSQKSRWYWIVEDKIFRNPITGDSNSGTELALKFFQKFVIPKFISQNLVPTARNFRKLKYRYLYEVIKDRKQHNNLLKHVGLKPVHEYKYTNMTYTELINLFKTEIYPFFSKKKNLPSNTAPLVEEVSRYYRGFINKIYETPRKTYLDFVRDVGLKAQKGLRAEAGIILHEIMRYLASFNNSNFYSEVKIYHPLKNYKIDGILLNNKDFQVCVNNSLPEISEIIKNKPYLLFDYTNAFNYKGELLYSRLAKKIQNYFKNPSKEILFILGTDWNQPNDFYTLPAVILYDNKKINTSGVYVISPSFFKKLLRLEGEIGYMFQESILNNINMNIKKMKEILDNLLEKNIQLFSTKCLLKKVNTDSLIQIFDQNY